MSVLKELKLCRIHKDCKGFIRTYLSYEDRRSKEVLQELYYFLFEGKKFGACIQLMGYMASKGFKLNLHKEMTRRVIAKN